MTFHFHSLAKMHVLTEQLKITHKDSAIKSGKIWMRLAEILSKPVALALTRGKYQRLGN